MPPKILTLDIETAPNIAAVWSLWKQNISLPQLLEPSYVLCWSAKWKGTSKILFDSVYKSGQRHMIKGIWGLLDEADIVIHFNGRRFDIPTLNKEFLSLGLLPPSSYKQIDLLETAKTRFNFVSNKLAYITKFLKLDGKIETGFKLWLDVMRNDAKAWAKMEKYNKNDVIETEKLYDRLLPWIVSHPNLGLYAKLHGVTCPTCGSDKVQRRGLSHMKTQSYQRYQCQNCGSWMRSRFSEKGLDRKFVMIPTAE